jgi:hypothetical protein
VVELIGAYVKFARSYYQQDGESTGTVERLGPVLRLLKERYGHTDVDDFRPLAIEALQQNMIEMGHARSYVNMNIARIKRMFRWGVGKELVPVEVLQRLQAVCGLSNCNRGTGPWPTAGGRLPSAPSVRLEKETRK